MPRRDNRIAGNYVSETVVTRATGSAGRMTRAELESFIVDEARGAWAVLSEMDRERGGTGELHDTAISLMRGRTMIAIHCDYHSDDRMLTAWFRLPEPLPPDEDLTFREVVGDWARYEGGFLSRLH